MSTNVRIVHARDFIVATPEGQLDFEKSKNLLLEIASAASPLADYDILLDTRKAQMAMTVTDLWYLVVEMTNSRQAFQHKTAVLCPIERFDRAAFFALFSQNRGLQVKAFTTLDEAFEWLTVEAT